MCLNSIPKFLVNDHFKVKCKFNNQELQHYNYFNELTKKDSLILNNVIIKNGFVFFFINSRDYFKAKKYLSILRKRLKRKVIIVRNEQNFIRMLFSFFPDTYIHDIIFSLDEEKKQLNIELFFLTGEEYGIASGTSGLYVQVVNLIFNRSIKNPNFKFSVNIQCKLTKTLTY